MRVDAHSHILPGVDDGSASPEESVAMMRLEAEQGITHVVATPHFYAHHDTPEKFLSRRDRAEEALRRCMEAESGLPQLHVGAEAAFFRGMSEWEFLPQLTVGDHLLVEMPAAPWTEEMYRELIRIREVRGITPIIAHIDRYIAPLRTGGIPRRLAEMPVLVQANAEFFLRAATSAMAMRMLKAGQIHLLGSDCHNMRSRKPNLGGARDRIERKLGAQALEKIRENEHRVLGV